MGKDKKNWKYEETEEEEEEEIDETSSDLNI